MKQFFFIAALSMILFSCKKDPQDTPAPVTPAPSTASTEAFTKLTPGNYWVYEQYRVDTNGVETYLQTDSMWVSRDTVYHGNTYACVGTTIYWGGWFRDSSGYMVDTAHHVCFTTAVTGTPVRVDTLWPGAYVSFQTTNNHPTVQVPAGTFTNTYEWQGAYYNASPWGSPRMETHYFAPGIGRVLIRYFYSTAPFNYEDRLVRYHVQ